MIPGVAPRYFSSEESSRSVSAQHLWSSPDLFIDSLTIGAVPVTAGIVVDFYMPAFCAFTDAIAEFSGFAVHDGFGSLFLDI